MVNVTFQILKIYIFPMRHFLLSNNSKLKYKTYPIEVKSSKKYTTISLLKFRGKYKNRIGECYIVHPRNLIIKDDIICIPSYMVMML